MNAISRRHFLEDALLAAAASAVIAPTPSIAAGNKPSRSPNERLKVAVLGATGRGQGHADAYAARSDGLPIGLRLRCRPGDRREVRPPGRTPRDGRVKFVQDIDGSSTTSRSTSFHRYAQSLALAGGDLGDAGQGKDMYVEKPVSHDVSERRRMVEVARMSPYLPGRHAEPLHRLPTTRPPSTSQSGKLGQIPQLVHCVMHRPSASPIGPAGQVRSAAERGLQSLGGSGPDRPPSRASRSITTGTGTGISATARSATTTCTRWIRLGCIAGLSGLGRGVISYGGRVAFHDAGSPQRPGGDS